MSAFEKHEEILSLLRSEFERERMNNFALLRQIPSTGVRRVLDYFSSLHVAEADSFAEALAQGALCTFFPGQVKHPSETGNAAWNRAQYARATTVRWQVEWNYWAVKELREHLAFVRSNPEFDNVPKEIKHKMESIKPVKSTEIRRVIKLALSQSLPPLSVNHTGPYWRYDGFLDGRAITVNIEYGLRNAQFEYGIPHPFQSREVGKPRIDLNYERLLGVGNGEWNCLEQANLDQSIALLKDLIVHCGRFLGRLPSPDNGPKPV